MHYNNYIVTWNNADVIHLRVINYMKKRVDILVSKNQALKYNTTYDHYLQCNDTVLNRTKHKKYLIGGIMHHQSVVYY